MKKHLDYRVTPLIFFSFLVLVLLFFAACEEDPEPCCFGSCPSEILTVYEMNVERYRQQQELGYEIVRSPEIMEPNSLSVAQRKIRDLNCWGGRNIKYLVKAEVINTSNQRGEFNIRVRVNINDNESSESFSWDEMIEAGESVLISKEFNARCGLKHSVSTFNVESPIIETVIVDTTYTPREFNVVPLLVRPERSQVELHLRPSFERDAKSNERVRAGGELFFLGDIASEMTFNAPSGEVLQGHFVKVMLKDDLTEYWIFSPYVQCLEMAGGSSLGEHSKEELNGAEAQGETIPPAEYAEESIQQENPEVGSVEDEESADGTEASERAGSPEATAVDHKSLGSGLVGGGLSSRGVRHIPTMTDNSQQSGRVVVQLCVNSDGKVMANSVKFTQRGSTTTDRQLMNAAIENAKHWIFSPASVDQQCGTITYNFKVQ